MTALARIHTYLHANARVRAREIFQIGNLTIYRGTVTDPCESLVLANADETGHITRSLAQAQALVDESSGRARLRLIAEMFPRLIAELGQLGLPQRRREPLMVCTPDSLRSAGDVPGLTIVTLASDSPLRNVQLELEINERGFDPDFSGTITAEQAERFRSTLVTARAFTAHLDGEAVAAGMFHTPMDGITQISGVATLAAFRGRGIASTLTTFMTRAAFDAGVEMVYLAAANDPARRVYDRIGYREAGTLLTYEVDHSASY